MTGLFRTLAVGLLILGAAPAQAELTQAQLDAIDGKSGVRVFASDARFVGVTNGISIQDGRVRLVIVPKAGSIFRNAGGKDVIVTTLPRKLTLRGSDLFLDADTTRLRVKGSGSFTDDSAPLTILLLSP